MKRPYWLYINDIFIVLNLLFWWEGKGTFYLVMGVLFFLVLVGSTILKVWQND